MAGRKKKEGHSLGYTALILSLKDFQELKLAACEQNEDKNTFWGHLSKKNMYYSSVEQFYQFGVVLKLNQYL